MLIIFEMYWLTCLPFASLCLPGYEQLTSIMNVANDVNVFYEG